MHVGKRTWAELAGNMLHVGKRTWAMSPGDMATGGKRTWREWADGRREWAGGVAGGNWHSTVLQTSGPVHTAYLAATSLICEVPHTDNDIIFSVCPFKDRVKQFLFSILEIPSQCIAT